MAKRSLQDKVKQLQEHFDGNMIDQNPNEVGEWSPENIAKNREAAIKQSNPWLAYNMSCSEWYDKVVKPKMQGAQAA